MANDQYKARLYRRRAEDLVVTAQGMTETAQRALLFQIAADYHKLAVALEDAAHAQARDNEGPGRAASLGVPSADIDTGGVHRPNGADEHAFRARQDPGDKAEREGNKHRDADDDG
jgi:hypothetical protein